MRKANIFIINFLIKKSKFVKIEIVMTTAIIRHKLYDYIRMAKDKKIKAIYTMLEEEIEEVYEHWNDKNFVAELNKRSSDYKDGKIKGISWETGKAKILTSSTGKRK